MEEEGKRGGSGYYIIPPSSLMFKIALGVINTLIANPTRSEVE